MSGAGLVPDVLAPGLDLVICGTAPSRASYQARAYYANPGNAFWATLHQVGLTPVRLRPQDYPRVLEFGLGLTDLNKTEWGSDHVLSPAAFDVAGFVAKLETYRPAAVAFTSKLAAATALGVRSPAYGLQDARIAEAAVFVLASPSGRARSWWTIRPWQDAAAWVRARRTADRL